MDQGARTAVSRQRRPRDSTQGVLFRAHRPCRPEPLWPLACVRKRSQKSPLFRPPTIHPHPSCCCETKFGSVAPEWMRKDGAGRKTAFVQKKKLTRCSPPDGEAGRNFVYDLSTYVTGCKNFKDKQHFHHKVFHEIRNSKKKKDETPRDRPSAVKWQSGREPGAGPWLPQGGDLVGG